MAHLKSKGLPTLDIAEVIEAAIKDANSQFQYQVAEGLVSLPTRFPVQVGNTETRVYLEVQAKALGTSIAALSGLILDEVVAASIAKYKKM